MLIYFEHQSLFKIGQMQVSTINSVYEIKCCLLSLVKHFTAPKNSRMKRFMYFHLIIGKLLGKNYLDELCFVDSIEP